MESDECIEAERKTMHGAIVKAQRRRISQLFKAFATMPFKKKAGGYKWGILDRERYIIPLQ